MQATVGFNLSKGADGKFQRSTPTGATTGFSTSGVIENHIREQINRATIGEGTITIRDPSAQTQDIAMLNRDVDKAQEITRDDASGVEFYASTSAVQEIGSGFEGIRGNLKELGRLAESLPQSIQRATDEVAATIDAVGKTFDQLTAALADGLAAKGEVEPEKVEAVKGYTQRLKNDHAFREAIAKSACLGGDQHGFNLHNLFFSPAYASGTTCTAVINGVAEVFDKELIKRAISISGKAAQLVRGGNLIGFLTGADPLGGPFEQAGTLKDGSRYVYSGSQDTVYGTLSIEKPSGEVLRLQVNANGEVRSGVFTDAHGVNQPLSSQDLVNLGTGVVSEVVRRGDLSLLAYSRAAGMTGPTIVYAKPTGEPPIKGATPGRATSGPSSIWEKPGGMPEADADFDSLGAKGVKAIDKGGRRGVLPDGRSVNVRPESTDGRATIEIMGPGRDRIKIRYGSK